MPGFPSGCLLPSTGFGAGRSFSGTLLSRQSGDMPKYAQFMEKEANWSVVAGDVIRACAGLHSLLQHLLSTHYLQNRDLVEKLTLKIQNLPSCFISFNLFFYYFIDLFPSGLAFFINTAGNTTI